MVRSKIFRLNTEFKMMVEKKMDKFYINVSPHQRIQPHFDYFCRFWLCTELYFLEESQWNY